MPADCTEHVSLRYSIRATERERERERERDKQNLTHGVLGSVYISTAQLYALHLTYLSFTSPCVCSLLLQVLEIVQTATGQFTISHFNNSRQ
jgi:hypothetical protein